MNTPIIGSHEVKADDRGRLRLPPSIVSRNELEQQGAKFMLQLGTGDFLVLYPASVWQAESSRVMDLDEFDDDQAEFKDMFFQMLEVVDLDNNGRFQIPAHLASAVDIERDLLVIGRGDRYQIWSKTVFDKQKPTGREFKEKRKRAMQSLKRQSAPFHASSEVQVETGGQATETKND